MEKRKIPIPAALPNCPDRHMMVRAAIHMERSGYTFDEWRTIDRLCDSCVDVRSIVLNHAKDVLDMFDGLKPCCGATSIQELAMVAAYRAVFAAFDKIKASPCGQERINRLMDRLMDETRTRTISNTQTDKQPAERWKARTVREHPDRTRNTRVTAALKASLERETCAVYGAPYETESGCVVIPFPAAKAESRAWES